MINENIDDILEYSERLQEANIIKSVADGIKNLTGSFKKGFINSGTKQEVQKLIKMYNKLKNNKKSNNDPYAENADMIKKALMSFGIEFNGDEVKMDSLNNLHASKENTSTGDTAGGSGNSNLGNGTAGAGSSYVNDDATKASAASASEKAESTVNIKDIQNQLSKSSVSKAQIKNINGQIKNINTQIETIKADIAALKGAQPQQ